MSKKITFVIIRLRVSKEHPDYRRYRNKFWRATLGSLPANHGTKDPVVRCPTSQLPRVMDRMNKLFKRQKDRIHHV